LGAIFKIKDRFVKIFLYFEPFWPLLASKVKTVHEQKIFFFKTSARVPQNAKVYADFNKVEEIAKKFT
jgi:hypothetical protein